MNKTIPMIAAAALFTVSVVAANDVVKGDLIKHDTDQAKTITLDHVSHVANNNQFDGKLGALIIGKSAVPEVIRFKNSQEA